MELISLRLKIFPKYSNILACNKTNYNCSRCLIPELTENQNGKNKYVEQSLKEAKERNYYKMTPKGRGKHKLFSEISEFPSLIDCPKAPGFQNSYFGIIISLIYGEV